MFRECTTEEIIKIIEDADNKADLKITVEKITKDNENHTLDDLKQKIINHLYNLNSYDELDIELIKVLLR